MDTGDIIGTNRLTHGIITTTEKERNKTTSVSGTGGRAKAPGRWRGGQGARPPPELLQGLMKQGGRARAEAMSPEAARVLRERQRFADFFDIELVEDRFAVEEEDSDDDEGEGDGGRKAKAPEAARSCALCKREGHPVPGLEKLYPAGARKGSHAHMVDPTGVWMAAYPLVLTKSAQVWVHRLCALLCPRAFVEGHRWFNVAKEVRTCDAVAVAGEAGGSIQLCLDRTLTDTRTQCMHACMPDHAGVPRPLPGLHSLQEEGCHGGLHRAQPQGQLPRQLPLPLRGGGARLAPRQDRRRHPALRLPGCVLLLVVVVVLHLPPSSLSQPTHPPLC